MGIFRTFVGTKSLTKFPTDARYGKIYKALYLETYEFNDTWKDIIKKI